MSRDKRFPSWTHLNDQLHKIENQTAKCTGNAVEIKSTHRCN